MHIFKDHDPRSFKRITVETINGMKMSFTSEDFLYENLEGMVFRKKLLETRTFEFFNKKQIVRVTLYCEDSKKLLETEKEEERVLTEFYKGMDFNELVEESIRHNKVIKQLGAALDRRDELIKKLEEELE